MSAEGENTGEMLQVPVVRYLKVQNAWQGLSVFEVIRRAFPEIGPRDVFRKVRSGGIRRADRTCHPMDLVNTGDVLSVRMEQWEPPPPAVVQHAQTEVETPAGPFWIVREDDDLLVVSKPAGCASHPASRHKGETLIERVRCYLGVEADSPFQPALANRLDIDTSGVVLVAKHRTAQSKLGRAMQKGLLRKSYLALVGGWPKEMAGEILVPLLRHPDSRELARRVGTGTHLAGKLQSAHTRYRVREQLTQPLRCALLEIEILTGRTHQIRRHMAYIGHPVAGDRRYGDRDLNQDLILTADLRRMFLHAHRIELSHPRSGERLSLQAPLPSELQFALTALGVQESECFTTARPQ